MTYLALVRHGETEWNAERRLQGSSDIPLNDTGRSQALAAARRLGTRTWDVLVSSPLSRAGETADIIGAHLGIDRSATYPELSERHFGEAEGATDYEVYDRWPYGVYPGMEEHASVTERGLRILDELAVRHRGSSIVAVTHGGLIRSVVGALHIHRAPRIPNAAISTLRHDGHGWTVLTINGFDVSDRATLGR
ncbi:histidine phosphatase family protein [Rhodococcus spelaei]|uniref:Histidine phosphatase family protein n=1 Tax=Rhodococcus spelaei TaxID=2546320 RepID=A0A541AZY0_9NOCA|nr:histidine phosphatase family protein [Rhodococcus spelaei]TQF65612.1 histidine phosphatase family protein [Rhodococcus spelaei]